MAYIKRINT